MIKKEQSLKFSDILPSAESLKRPEYSEIAKMSHIDIFNLSNLSNLRSSHHDTKIKLNQISDENKKSLQSKALSYFSYSNLLNFSLNKSGRSSGRMNNILKIVREFDPKKQKNICEIGTDIGRFTAMWLLDQKAVDPKKYTGCDIIPESCYFLSLFDFDMYICNLAKEKPSLIMPKDQDLIILTEVIEHLPNAETGYDLIDDSLSMLSDGGSIVISYPVDVGKIETNPMAHQYQPQKEIINKKFSEKFKSVEMIDGDKRRVYHYFKCLK